VAGRAAPRRRSDPYNSYLSLANDALPRPLWPSAAFGGLLTSMGRARRAIEEGDPAGAHNELIRAQTIVLVLRASLRPAGGQLSEQLDALYAWILEELRTANIGKDVARLDGLVPVIEPLRQAWEEAGRATLEAGGGVPAPEGA
jgi:flagellar biosynthetic protein FliS